MKFELFSDLDGRFHWHAKSRNGKIVARSEQGVVRKIDAYDMADRFAAAFGESVIDLTFDNDIKRVA